MNNKLQTYQQDEIDIKALWNTLVKSKKFIIIFTFSLTFLGLMYILIKTPIYEVKSNVKIGFIGQDSLQKSANIVDPATATKILRVVFNVEDKLKRKDDFVSEVSKISVNKKLKNFITIKTEGISNDEALKKNKEVVKYLQKLYQPIIDQYILNTKNKIENTKRSILNIDNFEIKNIKEQIKLLKTQKIAAINEKIKFYKDIKLKTIERKIQFHTTKLKEYTKSINLLYNKNKENKDVTSLTISSIQMVNYQNLILNSQNKI